MAIHLPVVAIQASVTRPVQVEHIPRQLRFAAAFPPLRPAAFFWAVVPPWAALDPEPELFPPLLDAPGELAIFAARSLDMPFFFKPSYCFSFFTLALLLGMPNLD
jgi:hypothetical protein